MSNYSFVNYVQFSSRRDEIFVAETYDQTQVHRPGGTKYL